MNERTRLLLVLAPILISGTAAFSMNYPAYLDSQRLHEELKQKEDELKSLQDKLAERASVDQSHKTLESEIQNLRNEIPQAPYLDLLMLDVQRMADAADIDIIAVEKPDERNSGGTETSVDAADLEVLEAGLNKNQAGKNIALNLNKNTNQNKQIEPKAEERNSMGVKQMTRRLYLTGDYGKLIQFMKRLESYQRVLSVNQLSVAMAGGPGLQNKSPAGERAQKLKLKQPVMSFLLNIYYLP
jgi:hypothetical protein